MYRVTPITRRSSEPQIVARELADCGATHQLHVALQFGSHQAQRALDAGLAGRSQWKKIEATEADRLGADRESLQDMGTPLDPAIHEHVDAITHGIGYFRQLVERRPRAVQLPTTMVGDDDARAANLHGAFGIGS